MNNSTNTNTATGKVFARVVFLMSLNPDTDHWDPMALFPDIPWGENGRNLTAYQYGEHVPCCEYYAISDCIAPRRQHLAAVARLRRELRARGYALTEIDPAEWLKSKNSRKAELDEVVYNLTYKKDSELMLAANAETAEKRRKTA